jgi:7-keto-8-aminopelargonate synthetase-like enzyme
MDRPVLLRGQNGRRDSDMIDPMQQLTHAMRQSSLVRFFERFAEEFPTAHLKDLVIDQVGPHRQVVIGGKPVINFGCDSFLGLDQDPRVQEAVRRATLQWGTHSGASRAFASSRVNQLAEEKIADWLGTEAALIYPSVSLANHGAVPGLVGRPDLLVIDEQAHNSIHEGARLAKAGGVRVERFGHCDPAALEQVLDEAGNYRVAVVALDGVYSMSGELPPLAELNQVARDRRAVLYVDDAHGTGILGDHGRGTVLEALGSYDNAIVVGSLSKAFSCLGGFIGCSAPLRRLLQMRSNTYIFGGPVPPPYLEAICVVCDLLMSDEYELLVGRLQRNIAHLVDGLLERGYSVLGGRTPIISVLIGDEGETLKAGAYLFDNGYYVQSVAFPAVPFQQGVLRIQVNANHLAESIDGLLETMDAMRNVIEVASEARERVAA